MLRVVGGRLSSWCMPVKAQNAQRAWHRRYGVNLILSSSDGFVGTGEATPLPGYSTETWEQTREILMEYACGPVVIDTSNVLLSVAEKVKQIPSHMPSARYAYELALLDLASQYLGCSLAAILSDRWHTHIAERGVAEVVTDLEHAVANSIKAVQIGAKAIKVKVGRPGRFQEELKVIEQIASHVQTPIRVDANQTVPVAYLEQYISQLNDVVVEWVEEPVSLDIWAQYKYVNWPGFIALDESLRTAQSRELIPKVCGKLATLVLKPMVLGGLQNCLSWAKYGAQYGVDSIVSHLFDGEVAARGYCALAQVLPKDGPAHGLGIERAKSILAYTQNQSVIDFRAVGHNKSQ